MRNDNPHRGDLDDDDMLDLPSDIDSVSSSDAPRPAKRRRLRRGKPADDDVRRSPEHIPDTPVDYDYGDDWSYGSDSVATDDDLPQHSKEDEDAESPRTKALKRRVFCPKHPTEQEITFVTQLTQPHSSPSRIRGPRWKKPEPEQVPPKPGLPLFSRPENEQGNDTEGISDDDSDLRAAIAASLQPYDKELVRTDITTGNNNAPNSFQTASSHKVSSFQSMANGVSSFDIGDIPEDAFDIGDIPEDAFDTSPELSPNKPSREPILVSSQPRPSQPALRRQGSSQQQNLRQTTLFGGTAQVQPASTRSFSRSWPLASQNEPPTHHKLNQGAVQTWVYPMNVGKKRDYQFNIAQRGLFHNLLVALPTGLGKTFIAATIMLNWYRWTTEAQIVFVAPTKPLVSQQVAACFGIAGIPRSTTTMLTGNTPPGLRAEEWKEKRVFFMTPQTLVNDLKSGIADPKRIVLLVVDEAHRATGGYAYVEVVKFLQRFNSSFRVLALTATPGSSVEAVQDVIDGLNISRVEIRTEKSLDIREYVHSRNVEIQCFENTDEMAMCMELFAKALQPVVDKLKNLNAYWGRDPMTLTPYGLTMARKQWMGSPAGQNANYGLKAMVNAIFTVLASLAHAIDLLKYHGIGPFFRNLLSFQSSVAGASGGKYAKQIANDDNFKTLMNRLRAWTANKDFIGHPKLDYLRQVVLNHFMDAGESARSDTRIMIFAHFRDSAEEIVRVLQKHKPMILPHVFVGQAAAKGSEGMDQKTQLDIIDKFKKGSFNTIVATSIGEEGLDIGEVDLIVCYDSSSSPIRMLQRMGRTGRKRQGNIILLLMKGKEEDSYTKAKDNYEKMQLLIASGSRFVFHDDKSPRILPKEVQPVVDEKVIEIPIENSQAELPEPTRRGRVPKRPPKKFNMPDDVETGFTKASSIGNKRRKTAESNAPKSPKLEPVAVPSLEEVTLSRTEQRELEQRYCSIGGTSPQYIRRPRNDAFPTLQRNFRPTKLVRHGRVTRRLVKAFRKMNAMTEDCEQRFRDHLHPDDESEQRVKSSGKAKEDRALASGEGLFCTQDSGRRALSPRLDSPDRLEGSHVFSSQASFDLPDVESLLNRHLSENGIGQSKAKGSLDDPGPRPSQRRRQPFALDDSDDFDD